MKNFKKFRKNEPVLVYGCAPNDFFKDEKEIQADIEKEILEMEELEKEKQRPAVKIYGTPTSNFYKNKPRLGWSSFTGISTALLKKKELRENPKLENLFIEATLNCNEHCKHCGSNCGDLKLTDGLSDIEIIDCLIHLKEDMGEQPLPFITITGGEPLLRPNLHITMKNISEMGYSWGMTTNATLITKDMAQKLKNANLFSVSVSIDGLEESHNWFRESKNGFAMAIEGIKNLVEVGIPHVMVTTVVNRRNITELDGIKKLVKSLGVEMWRIVNVDPIGRAKDNKDILLDDNDYKYILDYIVDNNTDELPIIYSCNHYLGIYYEMKTRPWAFLCEAGLSVAGIQYNGDVGACLDIERNPLTKQGNIRERKLYDIWVNEFKMFRAPKAPKSEKCKNCKEFVFCDGGGWHTWDFETNNPQICMLEKIDN